MSAILLDDVRAFIRRFVVLDDAQADADAVGGGYARLRGVRLHAVPGDHVAGEEEREDQVA